MRTQLGVALVIFIFSSLSFASMEFEASEGKFVAGGEIRIRGEFTENTDYVAADDQIDFIGTRFRANFGYEGDSFAAFIQPQYNKNFGAPNAFGLPASGTLTDGNLFLHQGYARVTWNKLSLWGGRKEIIYGDHLVFGNVGWSNVGRSFDGFGFHVAYTDSLWVDLSLLHVVEGFVPGPPAIPSNKDQKIGLIYASYDWASSDWGSVVTDAYLGVDANRIPTATADKDRWFAGARAKGKVGQFKYRAESVLEIISTYSSSSSVTGFLGDAEAGFDVIEDIYLALEFAYSNQHFRQLYPTAHKWLGYQDLFSRRNIIDIVAHIKAAPFGELASFFLDTHYFLRSTTSNPAFNFAGAPLGTTGSSSTIGLEFDLYAQLKVHSYLKLETGFSIMFPGQYIKDNIGSEKPVFFYLQGLSEF